jgi:hypothetical protein
MNLHDNKSFLLRQLRLESEPISLPGKLVPIAARDEFIKDAKEGLTEMDESRLAGLGVTPKQLAKWAQKTRSSRSAVP